MGSGKNPQMRKMEQLSEKVNEKHVGGDVDKNISLPLRNSWEYS